MVTDEFSRLWYKLSREMRVYMEEHLAPSITEGQFVVLEFLLQNDKVKPSDLIDYVATTPAAVTTLLDRMEKSELIKRVRDEQDRRIVWIHLTDRGRAEGLRGRKVREQFVNEYLNRISSHNQQVLVYLLGKVSNA